jgi:hypothetical protein
MRINGHRSAIVSERHQYEIRGNLGSVAYLSINLSNADLTGRMLLTGFHVGLLARWPR